MRSTGPAHNVLILGAGLVARPIVRFFLADPTCNLIVASLAISDAEALVEEHPRGTAHQVDVSDPAQLEPLIRESDLVISLVPYAFHVPVARCAIRHRVDVITTSYVQPEMRRLDAEAREANVTILNEVGLDPGLDHMSAMRMIDRLRERGAAITAFRSCCGGLPAPDSADNPWKYKFSWSPRGALLAGKLSARYLDRGRVVSIPGDRLFAHSWPYDVDDVGRFEIYPNRDSLRYIDAYDLDGIDSMLRATIRYPGWCETMYAVAELGLLDVDARSWPDGTRYVDFLDGFLPDGNGSARERLAARLNRSIDDPVIERFAWAGLLAEDRLAGDEASPLDVLAIRFQQRMRYEDGERDMVLLKHEIDARAADGSTERHVALLAAYGEPGGDSATSRTVSLPAAVAGRLVLDGRLRLPGVHIPTRAEIYEPILERLAPMGIAFREWVEPAS